MTVQGETSTTTGMNKAEAINAWVERIRDQGLPAFTQTVQQVAEIATDDEADLAKLSELIKKDAGMTTKILQASNTAYRQRRGRVNTISRALVMLGVQEVKKICLTCSLLDGLMKGDPDKNLVEEMTRAFHSATQSRLLAISRGDVHSEEVFLSALMKEVGPLAFWQIAGPIAEKIREEMDSTGCTPEEAEVKYLGFTLVELSDALAKEWKLDAFIPSEDSEQTNEKSRAKEIRLSSQLTRNLRLGWDSENVKKILDDIENGLEIDSDELESLITASLKETLDTAKSFGVPVTEEFLPLPPEKHARIEALEKALEAVEAEVAEEEVKNLEPDPMLQLEILRDLSAAMMEKRDLTLIVVRILEGLYKGIGLDRVVFALLTDKKDELAPRIVFGDSAKNQLKSDFHFPLKNGDSAIFF